MQTNQAYTNKTGNVIANRQHISTQQKCEIDTAAKNNR